MTPCTSVSYSKLQSLGKSKVSSVSLVHGSGSVTLAAGHSPVHLEAGLRANASLPRGTARSTFSYTLLFTREAPKSRKPLAPSMQPSCRVLEPSLVPTWHNVLAVPVARRRSVLNRLSPTGKASEREKRDNRGQPSLSVEEILQPDHRPHMQVTHLELTAGTLNRERCHWRLRTGSLFRQGSTSNPILVTRQTNVS